ncbi:MAG: LUD domain-containing protein [Acidobacteriota bacterium]|nr:LUD domain-containing protein [Acidobacteriota bacterium]
MAAEVVSSREEVLRRIRTAIGGTAADSAAIRGQWDALPRSYKRTASLERGALLEMLEERLRDYDATVVRVKAGDVGAEIGTLLAERGKRRIVIPAGLVEALGEVLPAGFDFVVDQGMTSAELDGFEGVLTASTLAIAETGTIVLQNVPGQGRRAPTLIPDYHLCVVRAADVVETVPEAMGLLQATAAVATTFVSGPSATADIEMTRIKGVHGPRFLDVILTT